MTLIALLLLATAWPGEPTPNDLLSAHILIHLQDPGASATGDHFANFSVEPEGDAWFLTGCVASVPDACGATRHSLLSADQLSIYRTLVVALRTTSTPQCGAPPKGRELPRGFFDVVAGGRRTRGPLVGTAICPSRDIARWLKNLIDQ